MGYWLWKFLSEPLIAPANKGSVDSVPRTLCSAQDDMEDDREKETSRTREMGRPNQKNTATALCLQISTILGFSPKTMVQTPVEMHLNG